MSGELISFIILWQRQVKLSRINIEDTEKIREKVAELCSMGSIRLQDRKAAGLISLMAKKANNNLKFARLSLRISDSHDMKAALGLKESDSFYDWVIIVSYYAMFHIAHALLATKQIRIRKIRVHEATLYAFAQYFIVSKELQEELFFIYEDAEKKGKK